MKIKKIKIDKQGRVHIEHEVKRQDGKIDEFSLTSADQPLPSFHTAFQALSEDVAEMCEIPDDSKIIIKGIFFSYAGDPEIMGVVITAQKKLLNSDSPLNLNTPHKIYEFYGETGSVKQLLNDNCIEKLNKVINEAEKFIKGEREQKELFPQ